MTSIPAAVAAALGDGIGRLDARGEVSAANDAMRAILAFAAAGSPVTVERLGGDEDTLARLHAGETVELHVADRSWRARGVREGDACWLVLQETTAAERAASATIELVRLRALAAAVGNLVHDFNNLLNAALGLAAQVRPQLRDVFDLHALDSMVVGTQQGAHLARTIARLLSKTAAERVAVPVATIVDEATAVAAKAAAQRGVALVVGAAAPGPVVRTVVAEAVQALWQGLLAVIERGPRDIAVDLTATSQPLGAARVRSWARVRLTATGLATDAIDELLQLVRGSPGVLGALGRTAMAPSLATAVFVQRRLGGDLQATARGDALQLDYTWPAIR